MLIITLKAARVNRGLTLIQASHYLNINKDTLSKYERDSTNIPHSLAQKMSHLYEISTGNLFFGKTYAFTKTFQTLPNPNRDSQH